MALKYWSDRNRVVITGFRPFQDLTENPSWEGVNKMNARAIEKKHGLTLFRQEIDVVYRNVDAIVPQMWDFYQPHLTIHVGLHPEAKSFVLEKKANKQVYQHPDNNEELPECLSNVCCGPEVVCTTLDVDKICKEFNESKRKLLHPKLRAEPSDDAQKFLCEYIYYTSLAYGRNPTLFVHVPPTYTFKQIAQGLERILELCLEQLPMVGYRSNELHKKYSYHYTEQTLAEQHKLIVH